MTLSSRLTDLATRIAQEIRARSMPTGGTAGQTIVKSSSTDFAAAWNDIVAALGFTGTWSSAAAYQARDIAYYFGYSYYATVDIAATATTPDTDSRWKMIGLASAPPAFVPGHGVPTLDLPPGSIYIDLDTGKIYSTDGYVGPGGAFGDVLELQASATHLQWRIPGTATWHDLVTLASLAGAPGNPGQSAYALAVANGFVGNEAAWLTSLHGADGSSAYALAVAGGYAGTLPQWITSLQGAPGAASTVPGPSAYDVAVVNGFTGDEAAWLASLAASGSIGTFVFRGDFDIATEYAIGDVVIYTPVEFQDSYLFVMRGTGAGFVPSMETNSAGALWVLLTAGKTAASLEAQTLAGPDENSVLTYAGGGIGWVPGFVTVDNTGWNANNAYSIGKIVRYSTGGIDFWYCISPVAASVPGNLPPDQDYGSWTAFSVASPSIPLGGTTGQVLVKQSAGDLDAIWAPAPLVAQPDSPLSSLSTGQTVLWIKTVGGLPADLIMSVGD